MMKINPNAKSSDNAASTGKKQTAKEEVVKTKGDTFEKISPSKLKEQMNGLKSFAKNVINKLKGSGPSAAGTCGGTPPSGGGCGGGSTPAEPKPPHHSQPKPPASGGCGGTPPTVPGGCG